MPNASCIQCIESYNSTIRTVWLTHDLNSSSMILAVEVLAELPHPICPARSHIKIFHYTAHASGSTRGAFNIPTESSIASRNEPQGADKKRFSREKLSQLEVAELWPPPPRFHLISCGCHHPHERTF